ncbi:MAG: hypothetical protein NTY77_08875 [Elusimicrobia bacterium]|nr:hypothetical protein [Elusimicrobiota bacterium]
MTISLTAGLCSILLTYATAQEPSSPASAPAPAPAVQESSAPKPKAASPWPGEWLADAFGADGLAALRAHGAVILQGEPGTYRLQVVVWKSLEALLRSTKNVQQFSEAFQRLKAGLALAPAGPLPFLALGDLPAESLMTAPLHALLEALEAYHHDWTALAGLQDESADASTLPVLAGPHLFDTPWGKAFAARTRADIMVDAAPLAQAYFDQVLAGIRPEPRAAAHLTAYFNDRYRIDISSRLADDCRSGVASEQLRADLTRYLIDQRRYHALARIRRQVSELEKKTTLLRDLRDLETVAALLRGRPGLVAELEAVVQAAPPPAAAPELTSAKLHLEKPAALNQHELGDAVTLSGAYWIDGLPAKQTVAVEEATYRETPGGLRDVESRTVKRGNGGPYTFSRRLQLEDSNPFTFHSVISAPSGASVADTIAVPVAKDFELALLKLAAADGRALSCAFPEAAAAYPKLEESLAEAAGAKAQYRELLATVRKHREQADRDASSFAQLMVAVMKAAADSTPEACAYTLERTEAAMALARSLPAGCDHILAGLRRQHALISRHAADQQAFAALMRSAASHRRACAFASAAEDLARGLAVLEADPEARCGKTAEAAGLAEADLPAVRADELWGAAFAEDLSAARAEKAPLARLAMLQPLIARIGSLSSASCFSATRQQAEKLAKAAGDGLVLLDAVAANLPADEGLAQAVGEVAAQRRKLLAQATALLTKQAAEQSPTGLGPSVEGAQAPSAPAAKPKRKGKAKTPAATEASQ